MAMRWFGWRFRNEEELIDALEMYGSIAGRAKVSHLGEPEDAESDGDGYLERLRQNEAIDRAMARLAHVSWRFHRLLHAYYRRDLHTTHTGWKRAMGEAGLHWQCQGVREEMQLSHWFDCYLHDATQALFFCHTFRRGR